MIRMYVRNPRKVHVYKQIVHDCSVAIFRTIYLSQRSFARIQQSRIVFAVLLDFEQNSRHVSMFRRLRGTGAEKSYHDFVVVHIIYDFMTGVVRTELIICLPITFVFVWVFVRFCSQLCLFRGCFANRARRFDLWHRNFVYSHRSLRHEREFQQTLTSYSKRRRWFFVIVIIFGCARRLWKYTPVHAV